MSTKRQAEASDLGHHRNKGPDPSKAGVRGPGDALPGPSGARGQVPVQLTTVLLSTACSFGAWGDE